MWHPSRTLFLRVSDPPGATAPDAPHTILLVDDEEPVRRLLSTILSNAGFRVLPASGLPEAMALEAAHDGPIHLLITDLMMPEMDGRMVARTIIARRPSCRVLFISGYPADAVDLEGIAAAFLQKPFVPRALVSRVRELLENNM